MILIQKRSPPASLVTYRQTPDTAHDPPQPAHYDGPGFETVKPDVRAALCEEQRGLCCYCNDRIAPSDTGMKIEHYVPQRGAQGDASLDLHWPNLLGACRGAVPDPSGRGALTLHCDSAKGDHRITLDPTNAAHMSAIGYEHSGRVTSTQGVHRAELDTVLNLNHPRLVERRNQALDTVKAELRKRYDVRSFPKDKLEKLLETTLHSRQTTLRPFAGYLAWWLQRAIRKATPS